MAVEHTKSTFITNADASPATANTAGEGGPAPLKLAEGSAATTTTSSVDSTFQLVRVPSNCKIKQLWFESGDMGSTGTVDVGLYYATDGVVGKPTSLLAANAIDQDFFASALDNSGQAYALTNITRESGTYTIAKQVQPLWQAAGLTSDPGGNFDICATIVTAAATSAATMGLTVLYTD